MSVTGMFADVKFTKLDPSAKAPTRAHESDAGNDLSALEDCQLEPGQTKVIRTGIALSLPEHTYGQIASRSSMAKAGLFVTGGVIDNTYTGECGVLLTNSSTTTALITKGQRVAQLIILPIVEVSWKEVESLSKTSRAGGGFGSSGR